MPTTKAKRGRSSESSDLNVASTIHSKRRKSQSITADTDGNGYESLQTTRPPLSTNELDRINYHTDLQEFASSLQSAANLIFPGDQISRYAKVDVILLSWEDEDPHLPVSIEIVELAEILANLYNFNVEEWLIPADDSHNKLQSKVLQFLDNSDPRHLKIVYYAGHGKLTNHGQPAWTSRRNSGQERCPTVKWSGIQNSLEESHSDVLILLDCCASGVCTTDEGNGVTELMAACAYNSIANGVGPFSFTHALNMKLRQLVHLPSFTVGHLYNAIFTEVQSWRFEDSRHKKAPIHLVLSQNHDHPRSIRLSNRSKGKESMAYSQPESKSQVNPLSVSESQDTEPQCLPSTHTSSSYSPMPDSSFPLTQTFSLSSSATSISQLPEYPRLLFSIRIKENIKPSQLSTELFTDWLRDVPVSSRLVKVEAAFASDSTLLMVSVHAAMFAYILPNPSITLLGITRSSNLLPSSVSDLSHPDKVQRTAQDHSETELEDTMPTNTPPISSQAKLARTADEKKELHSFNLHRSHRNNLGTTQEAGDKLNSPPASPGPSVPFNSITTIDSLTDNDNMSDSSVSSLDEIPFDFTKIPILTPLPSSTSLPTFAHTGTAAKVSRPTSPVKDINRSQTSLFTTKEAPPSKSSKDPGFGTSLATGSNLDPFLSVSIKSGGVAGVRCPTCAAKGQKIWVVPGLACGFCGTNSGP